MKSRIQNSIPMSRAAREVILAVLVVFGVVGLHQNSAWAEVSDREYELHLKERKRDFDAYVASRKKTSEQELDSALALKKSREASKLEREKNLAAFVKTMVRYSTAEVEAREAAYEETLVDRKAESELDRSRFVERRERLRQIEERSPAVDPYEEFEINWSIAPESKVSSSGLSNETTP